MEVRFADKRLERLDNEPELAADFTPTALEGFVAVMQHIRASENKRDLISPSWLDIQKLDGRQAGVSFALDWEHRLELELDGDVVMICALVTVQGGVVSHGS